MYWHIDTNVMYYVESTTCCMKDISVWPSRVSEICILLLENRVGSQVNCWADKAVGPEHNQSCLSTGSTESCAMSIKQQQQVQLIWSTTGLAVLNCNLTSHDLDQRLGMFAVSRWGTEPLNFAKTTALYYEADLQAFSTDSHMSSTSWIHSLGPNAVLSQIATPHAHPCHQGPTHPLHIFALEANQSFLTLHSEQTGAWKWCSNTKDWAEHGRIPMM